MLLVTLEDIKKLIQKIGLTNFYLALFTYLEQDFAQWMKFQKSPRHATPVPNGIIELMPICSEDLYSFKYVNGHPNNPKTGHLSVVAFGALCQVNSGYPLLISEMTVLTALRTAATSALASKYLAKKNSSSLAIIGCGAQSEFQVLAHAAIFNLNEVFYYDLDPAAMDRFAKNIQKTKPNFQLILGKNTPEIIENVDIIITATAASGKNKVLEKQWLQKGQHISGIGGDSPGKTELETAILDEVKIVVEYLPQTQEEGEIQNLPKSVLKDKIYAELWELISGQKIARANDQEITFFDSVGFALEDYSVLRLVYDLILKENLGSAIDLIPKKLEDPKDLFSLLS